MPLLDVAGSSLLKKMAKGTVPVGVVTLFFGIIGYSDSRYGTKESIASVAKEVAVEREYRTEDKKDINRKLDLILKLLYRMRGDE